MFVLLASGCRVISENRDWEREELSGIRLKTGPFVISPQPSRATISMKLDSKEAVVVEWWVSSEKADRTAMESFSTSSGTTRSLNRRPLETTDRPTDPALLTEVVTIPRSDLLVATLENLPAGLPIAYRVRVGKRFGQTYRFRTDSRDSQSFRFAAFGDTRTGHGTHAAVVDALDREDIDFVVHTGDMVTRGGVREQWDLFFQIERPLLVDTPIFPSVGNHDYGRRAYYDRYFQVPSFWRGNSNLKQDDRRYYVRDWGNLRLVALDGGIEGRRGSRQYAFASAALEEADKLGMFSVLFLHWPPYSSGAHGSQLDVREPIAALAKRYGVELVIAGHDHMYERTIPIAGTTYIVTGSSGAPTRNFSPRWFSASARTEPHYVLVDVEKEKMTLRAVNLDGATFDSLVLFDLPAVR